MASPANVAAREGELRDGRRNERPAHARRGRHRVPGRRLVVRVPRLLPVDEPGPEVQLPCRRPAHRRRPPVLQQALPVHQGRRGGPEADPPRHHLRQVRDDVPQRALPRVQGQPLRPAGRPHPAVPADARRRRGVRPHPDREGGLRGGRHHRHLRAPGRRQRRRRDDRLRRQGPDAARRRADLDVRPGLGRRPQGGRQQDGRAGRAAHRRRRGGRVFRRDARPGGRRAGADRRRDRQRARRPRHRQEDCRAAHRGVRRPRHAARRSRHHQAEQAAREPHRVRRPGAPVAHASSRWTTRSTWSIRSRRWR